eukprot:1327090-Amphidinium_carterae.1
MQQTLLQTVTVLISCTMCFYQKCSVVSEPLRCRAKFACVQCALALLLQAFGVRSEIPRWLRMYWYSSAGNIFNTNAAL